MYREAAYYDTAALRTGRVVIGDYSLEQGLPSGRVRVARLHFFVRGGSGRCVGTVQTAGGADGERIEAQVILEKLGVDEGDAL